MLIAAFINFALTSTENNGKSHENIISIEIGIQISYRYNLQNHIKTIIAKPLAGAENLRNYAKLIDAHTHTTKVIQILRSLRSF